MKGFLNIEFSYTQYLTELDEFRELLAQNGELSEQYDILPFFRERIQLSSQIATIYSTTIVDVEKLAYEYDILGDFKSDLVVGDPHRQAYCFIEFEDAKRNSLFEKNGKKAKREFSRRFEHGYSQIIDWFCAIDELQRSAHLEGRFGSGKIEFEAILVIGRSKFLSQEEKNRLEWRIRHVIVNSKHIQCFTFDELYETLARRLTFLKKAF